MIHHSLPEVIEIVAVLLTGEAGAGFVDALQFAMSHDLGIGVIDLQGSEQGDEGCTLGRGASVFSTAFLVETTLVADSDGVGIVVSGMGSDHLLGAAEVELTITRNIIVVATTVPAFGTVHIVEHLKRQVLVRAARRTVNYNQIYSSHFS